MMIPDFLIEIKNGDNVTERVRDRLISLTINDSADLRSDSMELVLDDRDGKLATPTPGTTFKVWLGYKEDKALDYRGLFIYDETEFGLSPRTLTIRARATNFRHNFKAPHSRSWDQITLGDLVQTIAADNNYQAFIHPDLSGEVVNHIDQTSESDLHLLTRLKKDYDATFKIAGGYLLFMPRAGKSSANTQVTLPVITLEPGDVTTGSVTRNDRSKYGAVEVKYHDRDQAQMFKAKAGKGVPVYEMKIPKPTQAEAEAAAKAKYNQLRRATGSLNLTLPGRGDLAAEASIVLKGWRDGVDDNWSVLSVSHVLDAKGYRCDVSAEWDG